MVDPEYYIIEKFLSTDACKILVEQMPEYETASVLDFKTPIKDTTQRNTQLSFLDVDTMLGMMYIYAARQINTDLSWNFNITNVESIQILKYTKGGFYIPHIDVLPTSVRGKQRKISFSVALNSPDEYEGGEFRVYPLSNPEGIDLKLPCGDAVIFPSFLCHEARPVTDGVRYSSTAWIEGPNWQ